MQQGAPAASALLFQVARSDTSSPRIRVSKQLSIMQLQRLPGASQALGAQQQKLGRHRTCGVAASSAAVATPEARTALSNQQASMLLQGT